MVQEVVMVAIATRSLFPPGQVVMTAGIRELVQQGQLNPSPYLHRHLAGDWGDLCDSDRQHNDAALRCGQDRLFSEYQITQNFKIWIITEWDRSVTTLLLPSEY